VEEIDSNVKIRQYRLLMGVIVEEDEMVCLIYLARMNMGMEMEEWTLVGMILISDNKVRANHCQVICSIRSKLIRAT